MHPSEIQIDLGALRRNVRVLLRALDGAELWAVVKADGYGHGATDVAGAALGAGASALCVATVAEALRLRSEFPEVRILVMGPTEGREVAQARDARLELTVPHDAVPEGVSVHLKLDTGMGRWGLAEAAPSAEVVGLMSHLATADCDEGFAREQVQRFLDATSGYSQLTRHVANSAAALRLPEARFDAARCGIALYGLSPVRHRPGRRRARAGAALAQLPRAGEAARARREHRLRPALRRRGADVDRDRARRLRGRLPPRPDRDGGARRRRAAAGRRDGLDGLVRRRARPRAGPVRR